MYAPPHVGIAGDSPQPTRPSSSVSFTKRWLPIGVDILLAQLWARRFGRSMMYVSIVVSFIVLLVELDLVAVGVEEVERQAVRSRPGSLHDLPSRRLHRVLEILDTFHAEGDVLDGARRLWSTLRQPESLIRHHQRTAIAEGLALADREAQSVHVERLGSRKVRHLQQQMVQAGDARHADVVVRLAVDPQHPGTGPVLGGDLLQHDMKARGVRTGMLHHRLRDRSGQVALLIERSPLEELNGNHGHQMDLLPCISISFMVFAIWRRIAAAASTGFLLLIARAIDRWSRCDRSRRPGIANIA